MRDARTQPARPGAARFGTGRCRMPNSDTPPPLPTSDDLYWATEALRIDRGALPNVRSVADKWRTGLASLTAVVTTVAALGSPYLAGSVGGSLKVVVIILLAIALGSLCF